MEGVPCRVYQPPAARGLLFLGHRGTHSKDDVAAMTPEEWEAQLRPLETWSPYQREGP